MATQALFPSASVDHLIERQLPAWLLGAQRDHRDRYQQVLREQQALVERLRHLLDRIVPPEQFAAPLLEKALLEAGLPAMDPRQAFVDIKEQFKRPSAAEKFYQPSVTYHSRQSLLAAALHNFQAQETQPWFLREAKLIGAKNRRLALSFERFASLCRTLDVGERYQALLRSVLQPRAGRGQPEGQARRSIEQLFEETLRAQLQAAVYEARFKGHMDEWDLQRLLSLFARQPWQDRKSGSLTPRQLYLLGKCVTGVMTFEWRPEPGADVDEVIAWIPDDPQKSLRHYDNWDALYADFALRLQVPGFYRFFCRFIRVRDRSGFDTALAKAIGQSSAGQAIELDGRHLPIEGDPFAQGRALQIARIFDDARCLAVPTDDEDREARQARLQRMLSAGLDMLGLAAIFVPGLGEALLLVNAGQLLGEVYQGYQAWRLGDRQGALDHLFGVAQCVALAGVGAGAVHLLQRVPFVDLLEPVTDSATGAKLRRNLQPRHTEDSPAALLQGWQAGRFEEGLAEHAQILLNASGLSVDQLRRLRVEQAKPPARLFDLDERVRLHISRAELSGAQFEQQLASQGVVPTADQALLISAFPGLTSRAAEEIIEHASSAQIAQLSSTKRVPLSLAERARWALRDSRIDLACLGLRLQAGFNSDSEQLAMKLVDLKAPWSGSTAVQLREASPGGRLLFASQAPGSGPARVIVRQGQGRYRLEGAPSSASGGDEAPLLKVLLQCLDKEQKIALGHADLSVKQLRQWLVEAVRDDREQAARLLGLSPIGAGVRPPGRFGDGHLAYRLSGGGESSQQAIRRGIHQIFPTFSELQLDAYLNAVRARGHNLWDHYQVLQRQLADLRQALDTWQSQWRTPADAVRRRRVVETLRRGWRRKLVDANDEYELVISGEHVGQLPTLPTGVDYAHVQRLVLRDMGLQTIDADFLRRFPNLVELDLSGNRLTQVPDGIETLVHLRRMDLSRNQLAIDTEANRRFARLRLLDTIELSFNPLTQAPDLSGLRHVRHVHLRSTGLVDVNELLERASWRALVDARDNRISELAQDLHGLSLRLPRVDLHDNPLSATGRAHLDQVRGNVAAGRRGSASYRHREATTAVRGQWTDTRDSTLRSQREMTWDRLRQTSGSDDLFRFLADFSATEDFEAHPGHYRRRVWRILDACEQNEVLREQLFREAGGPRSCEDRLLLLLSQLEVGVLVQQGVGGLSAAMAEQGLLRLGQQLYRLDRVDAIAARQVERMRASGGREVDEIEVRLFYRNRLAQALELPVQVDDMHFAAYANVTEADLLKAQLEVLQSETPQAVRETLIHRPFWEHYARRRYASRFEALAEPFHQRLATLEAEAANGSEQSYVAGANTLMQELQQAEQQLLKTLAEEAWARLPI
ncbi:NEL-type E3 ubiquitin ligase domain-containing protein [Pseudomonas sp. RIT623]|uniref:NEL-type E3 ubiquitin ligase domain-containing protein n=1 Tax=Pseudomonas sp. RIT623 TaxID=2559075 RepID=UPI00106F8CB6|nr:NEL-type E3 ubiquitin ligase domain-containing protein [Pseudomonas sp. RIT623]TFF35325.1 hypothetical protein E3U47_21795 [Pseudomonas sp. RIT623]